jgi:hypothetical protein
MQASDFCSFRLAMTRKRGSPVELLLAHSRRMDLGVQFRTLLITVNALMGVVFMIINLQGNKL